MFLILGIIFPGDSIPCISNSATKTIQEERARIHDGAEAKAGYFYSEPKRRP
jgi:hypothetical protein